MRAEIFSRRMRAHRTPAAERAADWVEYALAAGGLSLVVAWIALGRALRSARPGSGWWWSWSALVPAWWSVLISVKHPPPEGTPARFTNHPRRCRPVPGAPGARAVVVAARECGRVRARCGGSPPLCRGEQQDVLLVIPSLEACCDWRTAAKRAPTVPVATNLPLPASPPSPFVPNQACCWCCYPSLRSLHLSEC